MYSIAFLVQMLLMAALIMPFAIIKKVSIGEISFGLHNLFLLGFVLLSLLHLFRFLAAKRNFSKNWIYISLVIFLMMCPIVLNPGSQSILILLFYIAFAAGYQLNIIKLNNWGENLSVLIMIVGLIQWYLNIPLFDPEVAGSDLYFMTADDLYRISSVFLNPNSFAYWLILYLVIAVACICEEFKIYRAVFIMAGLFLLYKTDSRSAFSALVLYFLYLFVYEILRSWLIIFHALVLVALSVSLIYVIFMSAEIFNYDIRFEKWSIGLSYWYENYESILFGVPNSVVLEKYGISFSDNMIIYLLCRYGLIYFMVSVVSYIILQTRSLRVLAKSPIDFQEFTIFIIPIVTLPMLMLSDFLFFSPTALIFGVYFGAVCRRSVSGF